MFYSLSCPAEMKRVTSGGAKYSYMLGEVVEFARPS